MAEMCLNTSASRRDFFFTAPPEMPLRWVASGIEAGALWFLGREFFALECSRDAFGFFKVAPVTFRESQLEWSANTHIHKLVSENIYPRKLAAPWQPHSEKENTVINLPMDEKYTVEPLSFLGYSFADIAIGLFMRGATSVAAQFSVDRFQYRINISMDAAQVKEWIESPFDYEASDTVSHLPILQQNP